jgi:hypothetical protein
LNISPRSKVALVNASFSIDANSIVVESNNNTLQYKRKDNDAMFDVEIAQGSYTQTGFRRALLQALSVVQINIDSGNNNMNTSFQWNIPPVDESGKLKLQFRRQGIEPMTNVTLTSMTIIGVNDASFQANAGASPVGQYNHYAVSNMAFSNGTGIFTCQFRDNAGQNKSTGIMGLVQKKPTSDGVQASDFKYAILADSTGNYYTIEDGIATDSTIAVGNDESVRIMLCGEDEVDAGYLMFQYEDTVFGWTTLAKSSTVYDFNGGNHFPVVALSGANNQILNAKFASDPFYTTDITQLRDSLDAVKATKVTIYFTEKSAELMGFDERLHSISSVTGEFQAVIPLEETNTPPSLTIELPSLGEFSSYDSVSGDRRQILAVCPILNLNSLASNITYNPPYPIFVDIDNGYTIPLTQMIVRVLNSATNEPVTLDGQGCSMTIAFASEKESTH